VLPANRIRPPGRNSSKEGRRTLVRNFIRRVHEQHGRGLNPNWPVRPGPVHRLRVDAHPDGDGPDEHDHPQCHQKPGQGILDAVRSSTQ
jgi:hypothetical protein